MIGTKQSDLLKYKRLGNKSMNDFSKIGNKFSIPSRNDLHILKEHDGGEKPVRVALHDTSDMGFKTDKKSSNLEKGRHMMNTLTRGV